jgi:hypothetical protein
MKRIFVSLAGLATLFSLTLAPVQSSALPMPTLQAKPQPEIETFMGTVLKNGENFVLSDSATKTTYTLDNAKKASAYEGTTVKVTGSLDVSRNLIHVETIQGVF